MELTHKNVLGLVKKAFVDFLNRTTASLELKNETEILDEDAYTESLLVLVAMFEFLRNSDKLLEVKVLNILEFFSKPENEGKEFSELLYITVSGRELKLVFTKSNMFKAFTCVIRDGDDIDYFEREYDEYAEEKGY